MIAPIIDAGELSPWLEEVWFDDQSGGQNDMCIDLVSKLAEFSCSWRKNRPVDSHDRTNLQYSIQVAAFFVSCIFILLQ